MRIVFQTSPCYMDTTLPFVRALSRLVELHLVVELAPESLQASLFDLSGADLPAGIVPADPVLKDRFPQGVRAYWRDVASFNLLVHDCPRSMHPRAWSVSHDGARFIRGLKPDALHMDEVSLRMMWALRSLRGIPLVLSLHDPEAHSGEHSWRADLLSRFIFGQTARFILHNSAQQEAFCRHHRIPPAKVSVIPLGVYDVYREWSHGATVEDNPTVLFFGRLSPYKGLGVLYQAAPLVAAMVPGARFVVAGRPIRGYTPPSAPVLPNGASIEVIDRYIDNSELAQLFNRATVVVCPYLDATQSGVVLTAYAFGKPVVATKTGGLPEYVADGASGLLVSPGDVGGLATVLGNVLRDLQLRSRLGLGVRQLGEGKLNWDRIAAETVEAYSSALAV